MKSTFTFFLMCLFLYALYLSHSWGIWSKRILFIKVGIAFIPKQERGKEQKSCQVWWQKVCAKKYNQTWYVPFQLNISIYNPLEPNENSLFFTKFSFPIRRHITCQNHCHLHGLLLQRSQSFPRCILKHLTLYITFN